MREINKRQVGFRIKFVRELLHLTQFQFGERLGVSVGAVNNWEMGRNLPSRKNLTIIAKLGVKDMDYMLYGTQSKFTDNQLQVLDELEEFYEEEKEVDNPYSITLTIATYIDHPDSPYMTDRECAEVVREFLNGALGEDE